MSHVYAIIIGPFQTLLNKQGIRQECFSLLVNIMSEFPHQSFTTFIIPMLRSMIEDGITDKDSALLISALNPQCLTNIILLGGVKGFISLLLPFILELLYTSSFVVTRDVSEAACDALISISSPVVLGPSLTIRYILPSLVHKLGRNKKNLFDQSFNEMLQKISKFMDENPKQYPDYSILMNKDPVSRATTFICQRLPEGAIIMFIFDRILRILFVNNMKLSVEGLMSIHCGLVTLYGILPSLNNETVFNEILKRNDSGIQHLLLYLPIPCENQIDNNKENEIELLLFETVILLIAGNVLMDIIIRNEDTSEIPTFINQPISEFYDKIIDIYTHISTENDFIKCLLRMITRTFYLPLSSLFGLTAPLPKDMNSDIWKEIIESPIDYVVPIEMKSTTNVINNHNINNNNDNNNSLQFRRRTMSIQSPLLDALSDNLTTPMTPSTPNKTEEIDNIKHNDQPLPSTSLNDSFSLNDSISSIGSLPTANTTSSVVSKANEKKIIPRINKKIYDLWMASDLAGLEYRQSDIGQKWRFRNEFKYNWKAHDSYITGIHSFKSEKFLITISNDCSAKVWAIENEPPKCTLFLKHTRPIISSCIMNNEEWLCSCDGAIKIWDITTGSMVLEQNSSVTNYKTVAVYNIIIYYFFTYFLLI